MIEAAVRSTALLGLAAVLTFLLRHWSAALRHLVWTVALAGALVLPLAGALMPAVPVPVPALLADALSVQVGGPPAAAPVFGGQHTVPAAHASQTTVSLAPTPPTVVRPDPAT